VAYITNGDIERRVGAGAYAHLADDDGDGLADEAVVDAIRVAAEGEVDSHLALRYRVPIDLDVHPELGGLLASMALDLAELRLRERRPPVAEEARRRAERALMWLTAVGAGRLVLPALTRPAGSGVVATVRGDARVLSFDDLADH
jgi:phage gp36-like protein